jgi:hypothetical protein
MFFLKSNPSPVVEEDTQVEISLDSLGQIYDIIVTDRKKLQSVVSVPRTKRRRTVGDLFHKRTATTTSIHHNTDAAAIITEDKGRLADCLRPASPLRPNQHRSSSCPPTLSRGRSGFVRNVAPSRRDCSLPPPRKGQTTTQGGETLDASATQVAVWDKSKERMVRTSQKSISRSGKPNLVTSRRYRNDPDGRKFKQ